MSSVLCKAGNISNYILQRYSIITDCAGIDSRSFANVPVTLKRKKNLKNIKMSTDSVYVRVCVRACVIDEDITWRIKADRRL